MFVKTEKNGVTVDGNMFFKRSLPFDAAVSKVPGHKGVEDKGVRRAPFWVSSAFRPDEYHADKKSNLCSI